MLADKAFLESLLEFIGRKLKHEVDCLIIGGNAMLYYDLRGQTKDLDMIFFKKQDISAVINIIKSHPIYRGIEQTKKLPYFVRPELKKKGTPVLIGNNDVPRFDLFYRNIFSMDAEEIFRDSDKSIVFGLLKIRLPKPEYLIFMKAAADRPQDREDIVRIARNVPVDWEKFAQIAKKYHKESERAVWHCLGSLHDINEKEKIIPENILEKIAKLFGMEI